MTEGRHHRRRDDDHTEDGIYFPPPREVPRPRYEQTGPPAPPDAPSPWAPPGPGQQPPAVPRPPESPEAPAYSARASERTARTSPWAAADRDELDEFDEFDESVEFREFDDEGDGHAPAETLPPPAAPAPAPTSAPARSPEPAPAFGAAPASSGPVPAAAPVSPPGPLGPLDSPGPLGAPADEAADGNWLPPLFPQEWPPSTGPTEAWTPLPALPGRRPMELPQHRGPVAAPARPVPMPGEASPPSGRRSSATAWWIAVGVVIVALAVAAGILVGLSLAQRSGPAVPGATCQGHPVLRTTATPEFAPVVERAAGEIGANQGGCNLVQVTSQEAAATLAAPLALDAWIPAASAWARLTPPNADTKFAGKPLSLARSPAVIAAPRPFASSLGWPAKQPTWATIAGGINTGQIPTFSMGSPLRDTAGLLAVLGLQSAMARTTTDPGIAQMRALSVRARLADPEASTAALLQRMAQATDPARALRDVGLFTVTEQELWQYGQSPHPVSLAAIYPPDGLMEADYPLLLTEQAAADEELLDLATRLTDRIRGKDFATVLTDRGLRPAVQEGAPGGDSLLAQYEPPVSPPAQVAEVAAVWAQYQRPPTTRLLRSAGVQAARLSCSPTAGARHTRRIGAAPPADANELG